MKHDADDRDPDRPRPLPADLGHLSSVGIVQAGRSVGLVHAVRAGCPAAPAGCPADLSSPYRLP